MQDLMCGIRAGNQLSSDLHLNFAATFALNLAKVLLLEADFVQI